MSTYRHIRDRCVFSVAALAGGGAVVGSDWWAGDDRDHWGAGWPVPGDARGETGAHGGVGHGIRDLEGKRMYDRRQFLQLLGKAGAVLGAGVFSGSEVMAARSRS